MTWRVVLTKQAAKDANKIAAAGLKRKAQKLLDTLVHTLVHNPYLLPYEKLVGKLSGYYSRRINQQHRLVYEINEPEKVIKVLRMWTHYE